MLLFDKPCLFKEVAARTLEFGIWKRRIELVRITLLVVILLGIIEPALFFRVSQGRQHCAAIRNKVFFKNAFPIAIVGRDLIFLLIISLLFFGEGIGD